MNDKIQFCFITVSIEKRTCKGNWQMCGSDGPVGMRIGFIVQKKMCSSQRSWGYAGIANVKVQGLDLIQVLGCTKEEMLI